MDSPVAHPSQVEAIHADGILASSSVDDGCHTYIHIHTYIYIQWIESRWHKPQDVFYIGVHIDHLLRVVPSTLNPLYTHVVYTFGFAPCLDSFDGCDADVLVFGSHRVGPGFGFGLPRTLAPVRVELGRKGGRNLAFGPETLRGKLHWTVWVDHRSTGTIEGQSSRVHRLRRENA